MTIKKTWDKLKARFDIQSDWKAVLVLFIFSIAGSSIIFVKRPVFRLIRFDRIHSVPLKVIVYILFIIPTYYALLFLWANILGQGKFFNPLIKKMLSRYVSIFKRKKKQG